MTPAEQIERKSRPRKFDHDEAVRRWKAGASTRMLADLYGVYQSAVWSAIKRKLDPEWYEREKVRNRARHREANRRHYHRQPDARRHSGIKTFRDPVKEKARRDLRRAVEGGKIEKPDSCEGCGSTVRLHGHHSDYTKPLDVEWLCPPCHGSRHRIEAAT